MTAWAAAMDFGVVHSLAFPECRGGDGPVLETLAEIVADETFGAVEIAPIRDQRVREQARELLSWSGLQVVYLPILPILFDNLGLASEEEGHRRSARDRLHALIDEAIAFDAPLAMVGSPPDPGVDQRPAMVERLIEDYQELCDYADARSGRQRLHITLEPFDRDIEKKRVIGPTVEAAALADAVDRENFGLTIDLSHLPLLGESAAEALQAAGRHLIHAHIGNCVIDDPDCPFYGDFHPRFGHPKGRNDLPEVVEFLRELDDADYWTRARARLNVTPILSMELKPTPSDEETSAAILANGKRTFMRAWAHLQALRG
jgi:sugar phosphate isomerase/epimerase